MRKLRSAGAIIGGKTNLDEFGMGSHSTNSAFGPVKNAIGARGKPLSPGGSSGGSAVAVSTGQCWAALGTDTGGSVRLPAAYNCVVGFKPSYGLVSRYGVVPYANSFDTVGVLAGTAEAAHNVFDAINGFDENDPTSLSPTSRARVSQLVESRKHNTSLRIGVPLEYNIAELEEIVRERWLKTLLLLQHLGNTLHSVSLPATRHALSAYYILAPAEASSNLGKFDTVRYGKRVEPIESSQKLHTAARAALGDEVQRRILLGAYSLSASAMDNYFIKAQRVRAVIQRDFDRAFALPNPLKDSPTEATKSEGVDVILSPTAPTPPPSLAALRQQSALDSYRDDTLTVPASLAGLPAISMPTLSRKAKDKEGKHMVGMQFIAQYGDEAMLFRAANVLEVVGTAKEVSWL